MKKFDIHLMVEPHDPEVENLFKVMKKKFIKSIAEQTADKKIVLCKAQETPLAVSLNIDEAFLEEILSHLRSLETVNVIDAEYVWPKKEENEQ